MPSPVLLVPSDEASRWRFAAERLDRFEARPIPLVARLVSRLLLVVAALGLLVLLTDAIAGLAGHPIQWPWAGTTARHTSVAAFAPVVVVVGSLTIRSLILNRSFPWRSTLLVVAETTRQRRAMRIRIARDAAPAERDRARVLRGIAQEERTDEVVRSSFLIGFGLALLPGLHGAGQWDSALISMFLALVSAFAVVSIRRIVRASRYLRRHPIDPIPASAGHE